MQRRDFLHCLPLTLAPSICAAQTRIGRLVVPFPAGGATDVVARLLADPLAKQLGHPIVVENRAGAGGSIGMAEVAKAAPDGLTLGIATVSTHGVNPVVYKKLPYDPVRDFTPICELVRAPTVMLVHPSVPSRTFAEFLTHVKSNPAKLTYGSPGNGSAGHMIGEIFKKSTNTFIVHIPYRGASMMLNDLLGGQIQIGFDQVASALGHVQGGRLRALAVSWHERLPQLPDVPTFGELALFANNDPSWFGLVGPAGLPGELVHKVNAATRHVLALPETKQRLEKIGLFASDSSPQEFAQRVLKEIDKMRRVAAFAKISLD